MRCCDWMRSGLHDLDVVLVAGPVACDVCDYGDPGQPDREKRDGCVGRLGQWFDVVGDRSIARRERRTTGSATKAARSCSLEGKAELSQRRR